MQRMIQLALACLLALTSLAVTPATQPERAFAADATVATCDEANFDAALNTVQTTGGGTIRFSCSGTITFSSQKIITTFVAIDGRGNVAFDGDGWTRLFSVNAGARLSLSQLTLQNADVDGFGNNGAAIYNAGAVEIVRSTLTNNAAQYAGGVIYNDRGTVTVAFSTFRDNEADFGSSGGTGGAIQNLDGKVTIVGSTFVDNRAFAGGAVYNSGVMTISRSTFGSNNAGGFGGAILNSFGTLNIHASTFYNNGAISLGGAIQNTVSGQLDITSSTFSGNSSSRGGVINPNGPTNIRGSILANSPASGNCAPGFVISGGSNLSDDASCGLAAARDIQNSAAVNLGPLQDNGRPTQTMLPGAGSDAIDAADCARASSRDQRGALRPTTGTTCDIGAVEVGATLTNPRLIYIDYIGPVHEHSPATIRAFGYDDSGRTLSYDFDCQNDGGHERAGVSWPYGSGICYFPDDGSYTVGVRVCDNTFTDCDTGTTVVTVINVGPTITNVANDGPVDEGGSATITITATDPAGVNDPMMYAFDCDNDGAFEVGPQAGNSTNCIFGDNGSFTVPVRVTDDGGGTATGSTTVTVNNVAPTVSQPTLDNESSDEGQSVAASTTFSDPGTIDTHTCTVDYGDGSGPRAGIVVENTCTGPNHIYVDDDPTGTSSDQYSVTVEVTDNDLGVDSNTVDHTVNNVPPVIHQITTNGPVPQGQPVAVMVVASDAGVDDTLTYRFDCDNDGLYETAGSGNQTTCTLAPGAATSTIGIQVEDDDLGVTTGTVEITQTITLCVNRATGAVSEADHQGACGTGAVAVMTPGAASLTVCIDRYSNDLRVVLGGGCAGTERPHVVPDDGPLFYCESRWTGELRYSRTGTCGPYENAGVIPG